MSPPRLLLLLTLLIATAASSSAYSFPSYGSVKTKSLAYQFLLPHNAARARLGLPPLAWSESLASYAQRYANQRRNDCELIHSNGRYGENIYMGGGTGWSAADAVAAWLSEGRWYDRWSNGCSYGEDCGHYTQIVWRKTKRVGCARVVCLGGAGVFVTCNYDPPGNFVGQRPY